MNGRNVMTATKPKSKKKIQTYKKLNVPFTKDLHEKLQKIADSEHRSLTGQIVWILENFTEGKKK